jgi:hypothetical protein
VGILPALDILMPAVNRPKKRPGLKRFVEDSSDTGGEVRSVEYNEATNRSLLHVEADPLSQEAKNAIFAEMFSAVPAR